MTSARISTLLALVVAASLPLCASAQPNAAAPTASPSVYAPTPAESKATLAAALAALSDDHRAKVMAIVDRVNSGALTDFDSAERQVGEVLSPDEVHTIVAATDKLAHRAVATPPTPLAAGRYLLRHLITPAKLTELRAHIRSEHSRAQ